LYQRRALPSKTVWIPPGKFMVNNLASGGLNIAGVTVEGAGVWYSTIYKMFCFG